MKMTPMNFKKNAGNAPCKRAHSLQFGISVIHEKEVPRMLILCNTAYGSMDGFL